jgi:hypothetical protein
VPVHSLQVTPQLGAQVNLGKRRHLHPWNTTSCSDKQRHPEWLHILGCDLLMVWATVAERWTAGGERHASKWYQHIDSTPDGLAQPGSGLHCSSAPVLPNLCWRTTSVRNCATCWSAWDLRPVIKTRLVLWLYTPCQYLTPGAAPPTDRQIDLCLHHLPQQHVRCYWMAGTWRCPEGPSALHLTHTTGMVTAQAPSGRTGWCTHARAGNQKAVASPYLPCLHCLSKCPACPTL